MQFSQLRGLRRPVELAQRAVESGKLSHAILLLGPEGTGQMAFALALAAFLNCKSPENGDACGKCPDCLKTAKMIHPDLHFILPATGLGQSDSFDKSPTAEVLNAFRTSFLENPWIELDDWGKSLQAEGKQFQISVGEMRNLRSKMSLTAYEGKYKIVIIWHAEKMNVQAANSFLKLLEEPPSNTILILTANNSGDLLPTIRSRCQSILVNRIPTLDIQQYLIEKYQLEADQALNIALMADGSLRQAQILAEQDNSGSSEKFPSWMRLCYEGTYPDLASLAEDFSRENREFQKFFLEGALHRVRDSLKVRYLPEKNILFPEADVRFLKNLNKTLTPGKLERIAALLDHAIYQIGRNANGRMVFIALSLKIHQVFREKELHNPVFSR